MENISIVAEFILLGFSIHPNLRFNIFCLVLLFYMMTMTGNLFIVFLVVLNTTIQRPMYWFLANLAIIDICFINTTLPNLLKEISNNSNSISLSSCLTQMYSHVLSGTAEFLLLAVMSFDRYLAICFPLHYNAIMKRQVCIHLTVAVWYGSFFLTCIPAYLIMQLPYCFSNIDHFFCDVYPLLKNSCTSSPLIEKCILVSSSLIIVSLLVTIISYGNIIITVVKIKTNKGKQRVFTTCSSHAIVVSLVYGSCIFTYFHPSQIQRYYFNKHVSILNAVIVPLINPFIYTLRNQSMKEEIHKIYLKLTSKRL
ncbi:olfactory receptor 2AP1-like [Lithobates pipiens]